MAGKGEGKNPSKGSERNGGGYLLIDVPSIVIGY